MASVCTEGCNFCSTALAKYSCLVHVKPMNFQATPGSKLSTSRCVVVLLLFSFALKKRESTKWTRTAQTYMGVFITWGEWKLNRNRWKLFDWSHLQMLRGLRTGQWERPETETPPVQREQEGYHMCLQCVCVWTLALVNETWAELKGATQYSDGEGKAQMMDCLGLPGKKVLSHADGALPFTLFHCSLPLNVDDFHATFVSLVGYFFCY